MAVLPSASLVIDESSGAFAGGNKYCVVMSCVSQNADFVPRAVSSSQGLISQYGYSPGIDYCSLHFQKTKLPVIFVGLPIATPGVVLSQNNSGVTGTSTVSVAVGASGSMDQCSGVATVVTGTTVGTDQITFDLSMDGGTSTQRVRLGSNTTYVIPNLGLTLSFGPGTLNLGDTFKFTTSAPMWGSTAIASARAALAKQQNLARTWMVVGDVPNSTFGNYVVTEVNNYASTNSRFTVARAQVTDYLPLPTKSQTTVKAVGTALSLVFASGGHTITRTVGSWVTDGFVVGQGVTVTGSVSNNGFVGVLTGVSATVLTFASGCVNETVTVATVNGSDTLTFAAAGPTITRSAGSFVTEGFAVGQTVSVTGTASNNIVALAITALSATVMTFASGIANEGPVASSSVVLSQVLTSVAWVASQTATFATIDAQRRVDLGYGRARVQSPITGWLLRRPAQWAASLREHLHDLQIPCWRKSDGPLDGFSLTDANGNTVEFDENIDGGALAGRFTCLRSYGNGPLGAFVALSLTRDTEGLLLSRTHNMEVANLACTVVQAETENAIGQVLILNADGTGTDASLKLIEGRVNRQLQVNLLQNFDEGPRASKAVWTASRTDILNVAAAALNGTLALLINGTLEKISTTVRVQTAGS